MRLQSLLENEVKEEKERYDWMWESKSYKLGDGGERVQKFLGWVLPKLGIKKPDIIEFGCGGSKLFQRLQFNSFYN